MDVSPVQSENAPFPIYNIMRYLRHCFLLLDVVFSDKIKRRDGFMRYLCGTIFRLIGETTNIEKRLWFSGQDLRGISEAAFEQKGTSYDSIQNTSEWQ
jgi:hypothetical protein